MELSRQMLLLTAENYGSYYLHITKNFADNHFFEQNLKKQSKKLNYNNIYYYLCNDIEKTKN